MMHRNSCRVIFGFVFACASILSGCAGMTFNLSFPDNEVVPLRRALSNVGKRAAKPTNGRAVAYVVSRGQSPEMLAFDLEGRKVLWRQKGSFASRVLVGEQRLYHLSKKLELMARAIDDGRVLWTAKLPEGARLLGMASDGPAVYLTLEAIDRAKAGAAGYLMAFTADGKLRFKRASSGRLGAPAARGGVVFVPLRYQSLAMVDGTKGEEIARIRSKEEVILWVRAAPDGIYFGGRSGVYRLDEKAVSGTRNESTFVAAALPESVRPAYWWDGYNAALAGYTAYDRNRLLWHLQGEGSPAFTGDAIVVHNYRFFFGFSGKIARRGRDEATTEDKAGKEAAAQAARSVGAPIGAPAEAPKINPKTGGKMRAGGMELTDEGVEQDAARLKWAYSFPRHDVVASAHTGGALVLISVAGDVQVLDLETGRPFWREKLGVHVRGATFDALGFVPTGKAKGKADLERALTEMIWDPDRRFSEVKLFGIQQLARLSGRRVAEALLQIVTRPGIAEQVYQRAGNMIVSRHDKKAIPLYLKTLKTRYSFIDGTRARAVDVMARALGDLRAPDAVRPLLLHLADHETPVKALASIARALLRIGDKSALEPLRDFLLTYRCEPEFEKAPAALNAVADALLGLGAEEERQLLSFIGNDSHTLKSLRTHIAAAMRKRAVGRVGKKVRRGASPKRAKTKGLRKTGRGDKKQ